MACERYETDAIKTWCVSFILGGWEKCLKFVNGKWEALIYWKSSQIYVFVGVVVASRLLPASQAAVCLANGAKCAWYTGENYQLHQECHVPSPHIHHVL